MAQNPDYDAAAFKQFEHEGWGEVSGTYHDTFALSTKQAIKPMLDAAGSAEGARLLDVACGTGALTAIAAEQGAK
ncbi:MAG: ubiquinone biosynthesis methyltransferase UbiE, partial [bacterium]